MTNLVPINLLLLRTCFLVEDERKGNGIYICDSVTSGVLARNEKQRTKTKERNKWRGHLVLGVIQATNHNIVKRQNDIIAKAKCKK